MVHTDDLGDFNVSPEEIRLIEMSDEEFAQEMAKQSNATTNANTSTEHPDDDNLGHEDSAEDDELDYEDEDVDDTNEVIEDTEEDDDVQPDEDTEDTPDVDNDDQSEDPETDVDDKPTDKTPTPEITPLIYNGQEIPIKSMDEMRKLAQQGLDYLRKTTTLAPFRRVVAQMEDNAIDEQTASLALEAATGNITAIKELLLRNKIDIDTLDLETDNQFRPTYNISDTQLDIREVVRELSKDSHGATLIKYVDANFDDRSLNVIRQNPQLLRALRVDMAEGTFNQAMAIAHKFKALDGGMKSDLEYYRDALTEISSSNVNSTADQVTTPKSTNDNNQLVKKPNQTDRAKNQARRKAGTMPRRKPPTPQKASEMLDAANDEDYTEWEKRVEARRESLGY